MRRIGWRALLFATTAIIAGAAGVLSVRPAAAASGSLFTVGEVVEAVQRQLAAVGQGDSGLAIDDVSLELLLVEGGGTKSGGLVVPGADFVATSKDGASRPPFKRRLVLDLSASKGAHPAAAGGGKLTAAIEDLRASVQQALAAGAGFDLKKLTLDVDFALERDNKAQLDLIVYARDRRIESGDVQGLKVRFSAKGK
jgi:hypothetical protein